MKRLRTSSGSMIGLVALSLGIVVLVCIAGIIFNSVLFQSSRSQDKIDGIALSLASLINRGNRVGQLNELEDRSRELIYVSRQTYTTSEEIPDFNHLSSVCQRLLMDARTGQKMVESERQNLNQIILSEIRDQSRAYNDNRGDAASPFSLQWLRTYEPRLTEVEVGTIKKVDSNVRCQQAFPQLAYHDFQSGFLDPANGLYKPNINAKLPAPDNDLDFRLCPLPAAVKKFTAQPRNTNAEVFESYGTIMDKGQLIPSAFQDIPIAVQVTSLMDAAVGPGGNNKASLKVVATGITSGASPEQED